MLTPPPVPAGLALRRRLVPPGRDPGRRQLMTVTTSYGRIDCLLERGRADWTRLRQAAMTIAVADAGVLVASPGDAWACGTGPGREDGYMGERSGAGVVEVAILDALDSLGARPSRRPVRSARVLAAVEERIGLAPGYAYPVLVDLAQPWTLPVSLVSGHGNFGSRGNDPPAHQRYTNCRLSPAGQVVLAAERGELAPVPVGLINGSTHRGGTRPPFRPQSVINALRAVIRRPRASSTELLAIIGPPDFLTGCTVIGDLEAFTAGQPAEFWLQARVSISEDGRQVVIENIPPNVSTDDVAISLAQRARQAGWEPGYPGVARETGLDMQDIVDVSSQREPFGRFVATPRTGTSAAALRDQMLDIYGIRTRMPVALPRPLATMIRGWARTHQSKDLLASLAALENAMRGQSG